MAVDWSQFKPADETPQPGKVDWSQFKPAPEKPGLIRSLADVALEVPAGAANAIKAGVDAFGAGSEVSRSLGNTAEMYQGLQSPARQAERQAQAQRSLAAERSGSALEEVKAAGQNFLESPVSASMNAAGSLVPVAAAGLAAAAGGVPALLATGAVGAGMGAGAVKGGIYEDQIARGKAAGLTPEQAIAAADAAQSYDGKNTDQIALGAGLGVLAGTTGVEKLLGGATSGIKNIALRGLAGAAKEAAPEAAQGGQERLAANIAAQREGYDAPTWQGVAGQATTEGLASAAPGAAAGLATRYAPPVDPNAGPLSRAAATAQATGADTAVQAAQQAQEAAQGEVEGGGKEASQEARKGLTREELARDVAVPPAGSFESINDLAELVAQERADLDRLRNPQPVSEMTGVAAGFDPMNRARNQVPAPSGSFKKLDDFAEMFAQEQADIEARRSDLAQRQGVERESRLESIQGEIEGNRQKQTADARRAMLESVLTDPETKNPLPRFESMLKREGFAQRRATPEERQAIERYQSAREAFAEPDTIPSAPNELDAAAMGIRERQPKAREPEAKPRAAFPMTREGAERRAAEQTKATGQQFEAVPHPTVKGRFAVRPSQQDQSFDTNATASAEPAPSVDSMRVVSAQQPTNALLKSGEISTQGTPNGTPSAQALPQEAQRGTAQQAETVAEQVRAATPREAAVADRAEPVLDLNKRPTGWKQVDYPNGDGVLLISADGKKAINFPSRNAKSGTESLRAQAKAQAFAIDNPHSTDAPQGELVVKPIFEKQAQQAEVTNAPTQPAQPPRNPDDGQVPAGVTAQSQEPATVQSGADAQGANVQTEVVRAPEPTQADQENRQASRPQGAQEGATQPGQGVGEALRILNERTNGNGSPDGLTGPENQDARKQIIAALKGVDPNSLTALQSSPMAVERALHESVGITGDSKRARRAKFLEWMDAQTGQPAPAEMAQGAEQDAEGEIAAREAGQPAPSEPAQPRAEQGERADTAVPRATSEDGVVHTSETSGSRPKGSVAQQTGQGTTPDAIWSAVEALVGPIRRRRIVVVQSADVLVDQGILQSKDAQGAQAFVKDGKAYFIAGNIQPGNERAVFLHEVGAHLGMETILSPLQRSVLLNRIKIWAAQDNGSQESRIAQEAQRQVKAAKVTGEDADLELIAYFVESAVKAGINPTTDTKGPIGQWFKTLWNAMRTALQKLGLLNPSKLTAQDIVNLAHGAANVAMSADVRDTSAKNGGVRMSKDDAIVSGEGENLVRMYHGTDQAGFDSIQSEGKIRGPAFFTPRKDVAKEYGGAGASVVEVRIPSDRLKVDFDLPGGALLSVERANEYSGNEGWTIDDYIRDGQSVGVEEDVYLRPSSDARIQFSRAAAFAPSEAVSGKARDFLADVLNRPGTFGLLSRTLQTQFHKATKNPQFRAVWTRAHAMFMDASRAMSRPAALAPELLPKFDLSNMGDAAKAAFLGKGKIADADMKAVADVLSAGTLAGGPGPMSGVRWSAQQMRDGIPVGERLVKLNDAQIKLYEQARAAIDASLDESAAAEAWKLLRRHTTDANLRDWIAQNPQDAPDVIADTLATVIEQETEKLEDLKLAAASNPSKQADKAVAEQEAVIADLKDTEERTSAIFDKAKTLKEAGYMPLMRFGQYRIAVTSQDDKGERVEYVSRYESVFEANRARRQLMQDFPASEGFTVGAVEVTDQDAWKQFKGVTPETVMLFAKEAGIKADEVMQTWYKEAVASRSSLRRMVHRKGYQGFSDDLPRVLASFITSNGKAAGYAYHLADMQEMMQDKAMPGDVHREARELLETITQPTEKGANVRGLMATWYLLGSVASAIVNSTQTATMTLPFLSQFGKKGFAPGEAMGHLARAYSQAFGTIKDKTLADAVKRAEEAGIVDSNEVFHLYAEAMKPMIAKLGSGGLAYRARAFMTLWGAPFAIVEKLNRKATFIAAYNMAKSQGKTDAQAFEFGERAVVETQGIYAVHNRPNWARGAVGGAILTFRQFSIAYIELAARMWQSGSEGKKAAGLMLGILFLTAGLSGMPGEDDLLDIIDTFSQTFLGKSTVSRMELRNWLTDNLGKELGAFVNSGVSAFLPLDVSGRMGMGNLLPGTALLKPSEPDAKREMLEVLGVPGSFAMSAIDGAKMAMQGEGTAFLKAFAPKAVQDVVKGVEMLRTGEARDLRGRKIVDVDVSDAFWQTIGFNPSVKAEAGRRAFEVNEMIGYNKRKESEIVGRMARGIADRDQDAIQSAQQELADWNQRNPETPIIINAQQIRQRIMQLQSERSGRIVKMAPPELRRRVAEALE